MKAKTNLTQDEIVFIEKTMFILISAITYPSSKFIWWGNFVLVNHLFNEMAWTITQNGKTIKWIMLFKMSKPHYNRWEFSPLTW